MPNSWLRLWHDMPNDPKWRTISRLSQQPISCVLAVYLHLLVDASTASERGRTQANTEDIASALDMQIEDVSRIIETMQGRVLDGNLLSGWEIRQPLKEDGSAERSKAWREKQKVEGGQRTLPNASERDQTQDKDKEERREEKTFAQSVPPEELAATLPLVDRTLFEISKSDVEEWSVAYPAVDVKNELQKFKVWLNANPTRKKTRKGISRAIVSWLGRAQDSGRPGGVNGKPANADREAELRATGNEALALFGGHPSVAR